MPHYRCEFVDHGGNLYAVEEFDADDDSAATRAARRLNVNAIGAGFDLWQDQRRVTVHRNRRDGA